MSGYSAADLLTQDLGRAETASSDTSYNGAKIWITSDGRVGYDPSTLSVAFRAQLQSLNAGQYLTDTFIYSIRLGNGTLSWATATVQFAGTNDAAVISGVVTGSVIEAGGVGNGVPGTPTATGTLTDTDVDNTPNTFQAVVAGSASDHGYGTYQMTTGGVWTFTLNNSNAAVQALNVGQNLIETFTVHTQDGTAQVITVTIHGTNDAAVITGTASGDVTEAGGVANAIAGTPTASGDLNDTDVDNTPDSWQAVAAGTATSGGLGTYQLGADGQWTYTLDNGNATVQALNVGQSTTDTFTALTADGTAQVVTVTIHGTNDAAVITGTASGDVTEAGGVANAIAGTPTASGDLNDTDVDNTPDSWQAVAAGTATSGGLGTYQLGADGQWTYTLDNGNATVQALNVGDTTTDTFTALTADGTAQVVTVTIHGTNDAAVITGTSTAALTETNAAQSTGGTLVATDPDSSNAFVVQTNVAGSNGYGTFSIDATGHWTYAMGSAHNEFVGGTDYTDSITVATADGTSQLITVTIHGANDAPVVDLNGASAGFSATLNYTAGSAATAIAPAGTVTDIDSANFGGGSLTVAFTANGTSADQLAIQNQGTGAGQIGVSGSNVTYGGTIIGTFTGGTSGSSLVITFNTNATAVAAQALADHILYANATSGTIAKTVTFTLVDGDGTANGGTDTGSATATINVTGSDATPPSVSISHALSSSQQQSTFTVHATDASGIQSVQLYDSINGGAPVLIYTMTAAELAAGSVSGNYVHTFDDGSAPFPVSNSVHQISAVVTDNSTAHNSATAVDSVTFKTNGGGGGSTKFTAPAGTSGEPINLALTDPSHEGALVTVTVKDVPSGWTIDGATHNADGSWTVQTNDLHGLTVTTPVSFTGAAVLDVQMSWINADGTLGSASIADNVEAYAPGSPIFAWSGDDVLTGSHGNDLFVFSQPIGADTVHNFDAAADQIDLIGYSGLADFADLQTHIADDANGNAVIALGDGQSITLDGVHSGALTASNFVFDQTPVVNNSGTMTIGDGALLPLSGIINNSGLISLDSTGSDTLLQVIQHGVTLQGGGQILLSDSAANMISGTGPDVTFVNVDNTIAGAGQLGGGMLSLDNRGTIIASGSNALVIDTGGSVVTNSGTLEATSSGGLTITGGLANSGMLWANGGDIVIHGQVTGDGDATIGNLSKLEFGGASSTDVTFGHDAAGTLQLDDSFDYSGRIGGITNDDRLDLGDILFGAGTTAVYQANQDGSGGTLSVSDGTHGAALHLVGSYDANAFKLADDGQGHTVVSYNPAEFTLTGIGSGAISSDLVV
ncbi:adhesin [Mesorhizobium sp. M8A.F.Ca.ET.207.01.1.1]|nr:adhesin [Mesorhizobium sp. M8A.F.Ca.ET.207.01.1.1]